MRQRAAFETCPEDLLVAEARTGSNAAFEELVRRHERQVFAVALRRVGQHDLAEDITQETFLQAYRGLDRFRPGHFGAWLTRIAVNRCRDELHRRRRRPAISLDALAVEPRERWSTRAAREEPHPRVERLELAWTLAGALRGLPAGERAAVILRDVEGRECAEVAAVTGVSVGAVRSRLSRGRARMRQALPAH